MSSCVDCCQVRPLFASPPSPADADTTVPRHSVFFVVSVFLGVALIHRRRKEKRFGPSPANDYTSGHGKGRKRTDSFSCKGAPTSAGQNSNTLPAHTSPDGARDSYATEQTRVASSGYSAPDGGAAKPGTSFEGNAADNIPAARFPNASSGYRYDNNGGVYQ